MSQQCNWNISCFPKEDKVWSTQKGYGQIINSSMSQNADVKYTISPWNRIQPLTLPVWTEVNVKYAWTPPVTKNLQKTLDTNCGICPERSVTDWNGCAYNYDSPREVTQCCPRSTWKNNRVKCLNQN